jgi:hypothetical protein
MHPALARADDCRWPDHPFVFGIVVFTTSFQPWVPHFFGNNQPRLKPQIPTSGRCNGLSSVNIEVLKMTQKYIHKPLMKCSSL